MNIAPRGAGLAMRSRIRSLLAPGSLIQADSPRIHIQVVEHWFEELKARVPTK
jgi:hypothetical protein